MKIGGGVVYECSRATALRTLFLFRRRTASGSRSVRSSSSSFPDHISFIKDVAATQPPQHLSHLLKLLKARGESIISPGAKQGLIPLAIPLAKSSSDALTALLRWPTAPPGMEMPVVEVWKHGVRLLAKNVHMHSVDQFIHRILVEEDAKNLLESSGMLFHVAAEAGEKLYKKGNFAKSQISDIDVYLLRKVGLFPDVLERKVMQHFAKGDHRLCCACFRVGRNLEAKDAARGALKLPWWTLGCKYQEVADIAQWEDDQIDYIKEKVTAEGKQEDLNKGKTHSQVALDEAAFLLDLASVEGTWDDSAERIAECYEQAGLHDITAFVLYRD
ncbi:protein IN CHLOROPLAST ATPASE BIOGENESIS [Citrus sinensis]|nr:protein IN CHLOROPLAST ATPASE BIOGENESIS [Citrus sinensis]